MRSDAISRYIVSEFSWVIGHPTDGGDLLSGMGKHTHVGIGVRIIIKNYFFHAS